MNFIIAGRFDQQAKAEQAMTALTATGIARGQIATFFVNPPGQHDVHGATHDPDATIGAVDAGVGASAGAVAGGAAGVVVGIATVPLLGPGAALAGAAVGAYVGSLAGALQQMGGAPPAVDAVDSTSDLQMSNDLAATARRSGTFVAIGAISSSEESNAVAILREQGAVDVERTPGSIAESKWNDFDPASTPILVQ